MGRVLGQIVVFGRITFVVVKFELAIGMLYQAVTLVADGPISGFVETTEGAGLPWAPWIGK
jgi:hypothetical protein